jgi:hypothetical protein
MRQEGSYYNFAYEWFSPDFPIANGINVALESGRHHYEMSWYHENDLPVTLGNLICLLNITSLAYRNIPVSQIEYLKEKSIFFLIEPRRDALPILGLGDTTEKKSIFCNLSKKTIQHLRTGKLKLVIYFGTEGFNLTVNGFLPNLHKELESWKISPLNVTLISGNFRENENYQAWLGKTSNSPIKIRSFPHFELVSHGIYLRLRGSPMNEPMFANAETHKIAIESKTKNKRFLCYNRLPKPARLAMGTALLSRGLLSQGLFSFPDDKYFSYIPRDFGDLFEGTAESEWVQTLNDFKSQFESLLPLNIDVENFDINWAYSEGQHQAEFSWPYEKAYFSIVNETWVQKDSLFLSEKIFKPIVNFHPFVVFGNPGTLSLLKEMGYKTFHPYINESYDAVEDTAQRLRLVVDEVERLSRLTEQQISNWYRELLPLLEDNYKLFLSRAPSLRLQQLLETI